MFKGFYNLTSGMLVQQRNLNVIANNMVNISTAGYKGDRYTSSTFDEVMYSMVGNKVKNGAQEIGQQSYIRASSRIYTNFDQGVPELTGIPLDFAIEGRGFFAVRTAGGGTAYTRAGNFSLDEEGYLCLPDVGRVLGSDGKPILLGTDKIRGETDGSIYSGDGAFLGKLGVYDLNTAGLTRNAQGLFTGGRGAAMETPRVRWGFLERSNVDMVRQMTEMMASQRALQSAAQLSKMYDQLMTKSTNDLGRL